MLAANDIDLYGCIRLTLLFLGLGLVDDLLGHKDLLDRLPGRGHVIVKKDASGKIPTDEQHHDGHHHGHHTHALSLGARLVAGHVKLGDKREHGEQDESDDIGRGGCDAGSERARGSRLKIREDVEEREVLGGNIREILRKIAQKREQGDEDGHLDKQGQAPAHRVELVLRVKALHLLRLALRVVSVLLLNLHELGLKNLHACG